MNVTGDALEEARASFERGSWGVAFDQLSAADGKAGLVPEDLERLATAAYMTGRDADADAAWLRAHEGYLRLGDTARGARCAFWQATCLLFLGEVCPGLRFDSVEEREEIYAGAGVGRRSRRGRSLRHDDTGFLTDEGGTQLR